MKAWLHQHRVAIARALLRLLQAPLNTLLGALVVGIALALPAGGQMLLENLAGLGQGVSATPQISLYLAMDASKKDAAEIEARLRKESGLKDWRYVSREETLRRLKDSEGLGDVIGSLPRNPFPDAFIVTPQDLSPDALEALRERYAKLPRVEHAQLDSAWVRRLDAMLRVGRIAVALLAALLGVALVAVTFNTIRLQILTQREEIEISRLLGATDGFVRRPFFYFGALQGLLGGLVAWAIVLGSLHLLREPVSRLAGLYQLNLELAGPPPIQVLLLLAAASLLGLVGAALSVNRHLSAIEPA